MNSILLILAEKSNKALERHTEIEIKSKEIKDKWLYDILKKDPSYIDDGGEIPFEAYEENELLWKSVGGKDKIISEFISNILKAHYPIDQTVYVDKNFYKELLKTYLHTSAIIEITNKNYLNAICSDFKSHSEESSFYKQALALEKNYKDASNFLEINNKTH